LKMDRVHEKPSCLESKKGSHMAYVLQQITEKDFEKIMNDAEPYPSVRRRLDLAKDEIIRRKNRAIDSESDSYFFKYYATRESQHFLFFYKKHFYEKWVGPKRFAPERKVIFTTDSGAGGKASEEVKEKITEAFSVYGAYGFGYRSERDFVIPVFSEERIP